MISPFPPLWDSRWYCLALIFILIPIVVGFATLRKKPAPAVAPINNEPLPPAS